MLQQFEKLEIKLWNVSTETGLVQAVAANNVIVTVEML